MRLQRTNGDGFDLRSDRNQETPMKLARVPQFVLASIALCLLAAPALSESGRVDSTPTGWWHLYGATEAQINDLATTEGARLVDVEVSSTAPILFNATFVHNSGDQAVGAWWWFFDKTSAEVATLLTTNNARLIDLRRY